MQKHINDPMKTTTSGCRIEPHQEMGQLQRGCQSIMFGPHKELYHTPQSMGLRRSRRKTYSEHPTVQTEPFYPE